MKVYQSKLKIISGTDCAEVYSGAKNLFLKIKKKSKRKPYIRSVYFGDSKIFLDYFWEHLHQKHQADRFRRLKFYACAIELLQNANVLPTIKPHANKPRHLLYRFLGKTVGGELFAVQVIQDLKKERKYFLSVFPYEISNDK